MSLLQEMKQRITTAIREQMHLSAVRGRSQGRARQGPGPPKCWLCPANENLKKSKYSNRTFKYPIKAVNSPDCALPTVKPWLRHCCRAKDIVHKYCLAMCT